MYRLFSHSGALPQPLYSFPRMTYLRERMDVNLGKLIELRRKFPRPVKNTHVLSRLLENLTSRFEGNLDIYRSQVEREMGRLTGILDFSSSLHHGDGLVAKDCFYKDTVEIVIAHQEEFNLAAFWNNWADAEPVRVLSHSLRSLDLIELDGRVGTDQRYDLAVITVNVPMLACQYQMWRASKRLTPTEPSTVNHFLNALPLTNAVKSHLDVAMTNLVSDQFKVKAPSSWSGKPDLNFAQLELTRIGVEVAEDFAERIRKQALSALQLAVSLPTLYSGNAYWTWRLPEGPKTNQVVWALAAARLDAAGLLMTYMKQTGNARLIPELTQINRDLVQLQNQHWFTNSLSPLVVDTLTSVLKRQVVEQLP